MSKEMIELQNIKVKVTADDWRDAIRKSGRLLVDSGYVTADYIDLTIQCVEENGPYIVLMPRVALAHYRPDKSVMKTGISLITLTEPIDFHSENGPVSLVLTLACVDTDSHLEKLQVLAEVLVDPDSMKLLLEADSEQQVYDLMNKQY